MKVTKHGNPAIEKPGDDTGYEAGRVARSSQLPGSVAYICPECHGEDTQGMWCSVCGGRGVVYVKPRRYKYFDQRISSQNGKVYDE
ncbi:MAG: hypothetical protein AAGJ81_10645 [Verrucomicrobiota bacterium]